jgi:simple sugar transport system ATP-binding protein
MNEQPLIRMEGIRKAFGPVQALSDVDLTLQAHEVHGLVGGNGAGKTTLMNVLYGLYKPDAGTIYVRGQATTIRSPREALAHGIGMVHQHFLQIPAFTVVENIVLGMPLPARPLMDLSMAEKRIAQLAHHFGLEVDPRARIEDLSMGVRQRVEILKALYRQVQILILDEPTTHLTPQEVDSLFDSLRKMVDAGMSVVFITHKLREVMAVCDTISVLRDGRLLLTRPRAELSEAMIVRHMVGADIDIGRSVLFSGRQQEVEAPTSTPPVLEVEGLWVTGEEGALVKNVTLTVGAGEIVGIAGVAGNGQQELVEGILGLRPTRQQRLWLQGRDISTVSTAQRLAAGIAYVPEDRQRDGFLPGASVAYNLILGLHRQAPYSTRRGFLNHRAVMESARQRIAEFHIRTRGPEDIAANLSGGNIQRVMLARALTRPVPLLIAHNPTSGLDIPSVEFIYSRLLERKRQGLATLLLSDDLDELLLLSDRIAILYRGEIGGMLMRTQFDRYQIGRLMSGVSDHD